ncbi:hypothetical protein ENBRE01_0190 [Enteropsectra breve]|nr:hypothetical protein ENBRE01_0190 [Enteropsectra breve]
MDAIKLLVDSERHEDILKLEGEQWNEYKVVAAISLSMFEAALKYCAKNSFEEAYILYRTKNFKKSLRILRKLHGEKVEILKAQCLYNLGYYAKAQRIFKTISTSDEFAVNIAAAEALAHHCSKNKHVPSILSGEHTEDIEESVSPILKDALCLLEYNFNKAFCEADQIEKYKTELEELDRRYDVEESCIKKQLANINGERVGFLSEKEQEVWDFNRGLKTTIQHPVHFQKNFMENIKTEYREFISAENSSDSVNNSKIKHINPHSDKMSLYKAFRIVAGPNSPSKKEYVQKILEPCAECKEKSVLLLLLEDLDDEKMQARAIELMKEFDRY